MGTRLAAMIRKEFSQLVRDVPMLSIMVWAFTGAVYTGGHGMSSEIHNYPIVVFDLSCGPASRELASRFGPPYFRIVDQVRSDAEMVRALDRVLASLAIVIPPDFERRVADGGAQFQVIIDDAVHVGHDRGAHIAGIANDYAVERLEGRRGAGRGLPQIDARSASSTTRTSSRRGSRACSRC